MSRNPITTGKPIKIALVLAAAIYFSSCTGRKLDSKLSQKEFEEFSGFSSPKSAVWLSGSRGPEDFHGDYTVAVSFNFAPSDLEELIQLEKSKSKRSKWKVLSDDLDITPNGGDEMIIPKGSYYSEQMGPGDCWQKIGVNKESLTGYYWKATW